MDGLDICGTTTYFPLDYTAMGNRLTYVLFYVVTQYNGLGWALDVKSVPKQVPTGLTVFQKLGCLILGVLP